MAITKISGNQISDSTSAIITTLSFLNANSVLRVPSGTTANRPTGVSVGTIRLTLIMMLLKSIKQMMELVVLDGHQSLWWSFIRI